jgi:DNA replication protein DnaC
MQEGSSFQRLGEVLQEAGLQPTKNEKTASTKRSAEYKCEVCHDLGWFGYDLPLEHPDFGKLERCSCMKEADEARKREIFLRLCRLPRGTEDRTFENFKMRPGLKEAYQAARAIAEGKLLWLTLLGGVDSGKTHLAISICRYWLERDKPARFAAAPEFLDELRRGYQPNADMSYDEEFYFYKNVDLLVLDDLGMESSTPWAQEKLDMLIKYREENALPLVVTTQVTMAQISSRIASRLQRVPFGKVVNIEAIEYRLYRQRNKDGAKR